MCASESQSLEVTIILQKKQKGRFSFLFFKIEMG